MDTNRLEILQQRVEASQSLLGRMLEQVGTLNCELEAMREELAALSEAVLNIQDEEIVEKSDEDIWEVIQEPVPMPEPEPVPDNVHEPEPMPDNVHEPKPMPDNVPEILNGRFAGRFKSDMLRSMSLNDRFRFQRELFHGSQTELSEALTAIEQCSTLDEAWDLVCHRLGDIDTVDSDALQEFRSLVELHFS